jgi:hypothetical protein
LNVELSIFSLFADVTDLACIRGGKHPHFLRAAPFRC